MQNNSRYKEVQNKEDGSLDSSIVEDDISNSKLCLLLTILCILGITCLVNLMIIAFMYYVLEIQDDGLRSMSFFKKQTHTKWVLDADFESVIIPDGILTGFSDRDIDIRGDNQNVNLTAAFQSKISMTPDGTFFKSNNFKFVDPFTKKTILDFDGVNKLSVVGEFGGKSLITNAMKTHKISSPLGSDLVFRANNSRIVLIGNEGLYGEVRKMDVAANDDISFQVDQTVNMLIMNGGSRGIGVNPDKIPNTRSSSGGVVKDAERYRLCMCTKTGLLFRSKIQDGVTCAVAKEDPCLLS